MRASFSVPRVVAHVILSMALFVLIEYKDYTCLVALHTAWWHYKGLVALQRLSGPPTVDCM